jgi:hypothetical protein
MGNVFPISAVLMLIVGGFFMSINTPPVVTMIIAGGVFIGSMIVLGDRARNKEGK